MCGAGSYEPPTTAALEAVRAARWGARSRSARPAGTSPDSAGLHAEAMQAARVAALAGDSADGRDELPARRARVAAGERPAEGAQVRRGAARSARVDIRARGAAARDRSRVPRRRGQRHARRQGALRAPEHRDLSRQAGGGADGPAGQPQPGRAGVRAHAGRRPWTPPCWPTRSPLAEPSPSALWRDHNAPRNFVACAHRPRRRASVGSPMCEPAIETRSTDVRHPDR